MSDAARERPILFSGAMVRAILAGQKTQTRRVINPQRYDEYGWLYHHRGNMVYALKTDNVTGLEAIWDKCPYGRRGTRLWVRETWQSGEYAQNEPRGYVYRATDPDWGTMEGWQWRPSIFMPRDASRITLEICDVRIERVQDISREDAVAEGITYLTEHEPDMTCKGTKVVQPHRFPEQNFQQLWDSINSYSWESNPWVWVVSFRRLPDALPR